MSNISYMLSALREGDYLSLIINLFSSLFVVFCCSPIHELSHAVVANKCGDDTAKQQGRLTINPLAHIDLIGMLMIIFFGIGYAKPVPVNPARLKHPRRDMALISIAGPISNIIMSFISAFVACAVAGLSADSLITASIAQFFLFSASVNASLAVFNLIPFPPLDGSRVLTSVLPDKLYFKLMNYERYIMIGLMILLFTGILNGVIGGLADAMLDFVSIIPRRIFNVSFGY